ncbi:hypothetical protein ES703_65060 [subsurface metagenome]
MVPQKIDSEQENVNYLFHLFCYQYVKMIVPQQSTVLDLGCGDGYGTQILAKNVEKIIGINIDPLSSKKRARKPKG